jgi:hypothetical protein
MSGIVGGDPDRVGQVGRAVLAETRELGAEQSSWRRATPSYINI